MLPIAAKQQLEEAAKLLDLQGFPADGFYHSNWHKSVVRLLLPSSWYRGLEEEPEVPHEGWLEKLEDLHNYLYPTQSLSQ